MRFTFTPGAGSISKVVITGPGRTATTLPVDAEVGELGLEDLRALAQRLFIDAHDGVAWRVEKVQRRRLVAGTTGERQHLLRDLPARHPLFPNGGIFAEDDERS